MYTNYYDCKEKCKYIFGQHKQCLKCNYYNDCIIEKEINEFEKKQNEALNKQLNKIENEEFF